MDIIEYDTKITKIDNEIDNLVVEFKSIEDEKVYKDEEIFCSFNNLEVCMKKRCASSIVIVENFVTYLDDIRTEICNLLKLKYNSHGDCIVCLKNIRYYCGRNVYEERVWLTDVKQYNKIICSVINKSFKKKKEVFDKLIELGYEKEKVERERAQEKLRIERQNKEGFFSKILDKIFNI